MSSENISKEQTMDDAFSGNIDKETENEKNGDIGIVNPQITDKLFRRRVWIAISLSAILYVVSQLSLGIVSVQYFHDRIAKEKYGMDFNTDNLHCGNASAELKHKIDTVQKASSNILIQSNLASGITACFTTVLLGSYSDYIGRKPILMASMTGGFIRVLVLTLIVKLDWDLHLYVVGAAVDGIFGSYFAIIMASTSIVSDITTNPNDRALNFAIMEGILLPSAAAAQVGIGYLIKDKTFFLPSLLLCGFFALGLAISFFVLPETMQYKRIFRWDPRVHLKKIVSIYRCKDNSKKRLFFIFGLIAFTIISLTNVGKNGVETLFELNYPLCWNSVEIGIYSAVRMVGMSLLTVIFIKLAKNRISTELTGMICGATFIANMVMFGLSTTTAELYIAIALGCFSFGSIPIPRALLSQLVPSTEQGALFSSLALIETVSSLVSSTMFTYVYNATVDTFKGSIFMIIGFFMFINVVCLGLFRVVRGCSDLCEFSSLTRRCMGEEASGSDGDIQSKSLPDVDETSRLIEKNAVL